MQIELSKHKVNDMKQNVNGRISTASIKLFIVVCSMVYSLVSIAQQPSNVYVEKGQTIHDIRNSGRKIKYKEGINIDAKAFPLNPTINGPFEELKPRLTPCGKRLYFSRSFHPGNSSGTQDSEDIWYSEFDKDLDSWSEPIRMPGFLNNAGPNYINNVSATGDTIILGNRYTHKGKMRAGLSYSVNEKGKWSAPTNIEIRNDYNISNHANSFVDLSSGIIISSRQRCEGLGERDLYVSFWNGIVATEPINMGTVINTDFEESSPYLATDGKTLYFASKGHHGHGGYDIYVTKRLDDSWENWSEPQNLGPAVNGPMDDEFFSITHCGKFAIFSKQISVHNVDLFKISMDDLFTEPVDKNAETTPSANPAVASL
jgi:OmpA-OmpF porin, OOP family